MDRVIAMILKTPSIREITAFPKNRSAFCPLTKAPSDVDYEQIAELGLLDIKGKEELSGASQQKEQIDNLSWLSRIGILKGERSEIEAAVADAVKMAGDMNKKAGSSEPMFSVFALKNRFRDGTSSKICNIVENRDLFKNAPAVKGDFFKVDTILE
jgi:aspartyl-tRNA synthetase